MSSTPASPLGAAPDVRQASRLPELLAALLRLPAKRAALALPIVFLLVGLVDL